MAHVVSEIPETRIKYKDIFSLKNLYIMLHEMLMEEGWLGLGTNILTQGSELHADIETFYSENVFQKGIHSGGKELWVWWRAHRVGSMGRLTQVYFKEYLDVDFHVAYLQEVEIIYKGKKIKVETGDIEMFFRGRIMGDDRFSNWPSNKLMKYLQRIYEKRIMHQDIEKREKELWRDVYRISSNVKAYLNLRTYIPVPDPFHPKLYSMGEE